MQQGQADTWVFAKDTEIYSNFILVTDIRIPDGLKATQNYMSNTSSGK